MLPLYAASFMKKPPRPSCEQGLGQPVDLGPGAIQTHPGHFWNLLSAGSAFRELLPPPTHPSLPFNSEDGGCGPAMGSQDNLQDRLYSEA